MNFKLDEMVVPTEEENKALMQMAEELGVCTAWELFRDYGIDKQKTSRAIRANKLLAFMKRFKDKNGEIYTEVKWYIVKNQALTEFIEKNRKK